MSARRRDELAAGARARNISVFVEGYQWTAPTLFGLLLVMLGNVLVFRKPKAVPQLARVTG